MKPSRWSFRLPFLACLMMAVPGMAAPITEASPRQLDRWLQQYPNADANGDGVLTVEEAESFRRTMEPQPSGEFLPPRFRHEFTFFTVSDGVKIALAVGFPKGFDAADATRKWPTIFTTSGYTNATVPRNPVDFADRYVTVSASIRGTGASGGQLSPWHPRTWQDGHEVIEDWIVKQPWSNGRVGIVGHSWPGLMGFLTATTHPPSLRAVCVSGLIDDFYRGIGWPGGVRNCGFSFDWLNNYYDPGGPFRSGLSATAVRGLNEAEYQAIVASRSPRDLREDILWLVLHEPLDGPKWHARNLGAHAGSIRAPILLGHTWQDEQTGPSGWQLWNRVPDDVPKRLALSNGHHAVSPFPPGDVQ
ncbi:MAG: CocE/NonD family hydrolase, partial [Patescibacteria group bacterium]|nr:CocE/NonD family hydrolase [Patescibacteria group bacterium]